jgi:hypothetical protein
MQGIIWADLEDEIQEDKNGYSTISFAFFDKIKYALKVCLVLFTLFLCLMPLSCEKEPLPLPIPSLTNLLHLLQSLEEGISEKTEVEAGILNPWILTVSRNLAFHKPQTIICD